MYGLLNISKISRINNMSDQENGKKETETNKLLQFINDKFGIEINFI